MPGGLVKGGYLHLSASYEVRIIGDDVVDDSQCSCSYLLRNSDLLAIVLRDNGIVIA